jgi:GNAT superfamily N-acetyltransferase
MHIRPLERVDADACEAIVRALPDWFGIEEGIAEARGYLDAQEGLVTEDDGRILGFLTFASEFPESTEITWMAVAADAHRQGVGRALVETLTEVLKQRGVRLLLVRTLADSHPSPEYAATRAFYRAMGFHPLTVLPEHWDAANPCLFMVRTV